MTIKVSADAGRLKVESNMYDDNIIANKSINSDCIEINKILISIVRSAKE